jgi:hypothetical protein
MTMVAVIVGIWDRAGGWQRSDEMSPQFSVNGFQWGLWRCVSAFVISVETAVMS